MIEHTFPLGSTHPDACIACVWYKKTSRLNMCEHCLEVYDEKLDSIRNKISNLEEEFHIEFDYHLEKRLAYWRKAYAYYDAQRAGKPDGITSFDIDLSELFQSV